MIWSLQAAPDLTDKQFAQWSKLLEERAGICLSDQQRVFLQTQVSMRMRELGHSDYTQYYNRIVDGVSGMVEWSVLIDRLVVKETSFFRHPPSIKFVANYLRELIEKDSLKDTFDLWSVGCSSGEEPYSLAMVMKDVFIENQQKPYFGVIASDISRAALTIAKTGLYPQRKVELIDKHYRETWFTSQENGRFQIIPELKEKVCFNHANVLNISELPSINLDVIFCQNMLIYFRRWLRHEILNAFVERLKPGGLLVIGLGEVVDWVHRDMKRVAVDDVQAYIRT